MLFRVGEKIEKFIGKEGMFIDINDTGISVIASFSAPTFEEKEDFTSKAGFKIRSGIINNVLFFTVKIGSMPWSDCYWLANDTKTNLVEPSEGEGYGLSLILINALDGKIEKIRLIGLGTKFSKELKREVEEIENKGIVFINGLQLANQAMIKHDTNDIVRMLKNRYETSYGAIKA